jgi:SAM-dependent methyltransferase
MVTLGEGGLTPAPSHQQSDLARSFGADPARYDRARPPYPQELADRVVAELPGRELLDVGIGTGLSAAPFLAAGCTITGVEVDPRMAAFARARGNQVDVAQFEEWEPSGRRFDAVVSGQSWHWIDPTSGARKAAEVLRAGGRIVLFWNSFGFPPALSAAFGAVMRRVLVDVPRPNVGDGNRDARDRADDGIRATGAFGEPARWQLDWSRTYTRDAWVDGLETGAGLASLSQDLLDDLRAGIGEAIDEVGGSFDLRLSTVVLDAVRGR